MSDLFLVVLEFYELFKHPFPNLLCCLDWSIDQPIRVICESQYPCFRKAFYEKISKQMGPLLRAFSCSRRTAGPCIFRVGSQTVYCRNSASLSSDTACINAIILLKFGINGVGYNLNAIRSSFSVATPDPAGKRIQEKEGHEQRSASCYPTQRNHHGVWPSE